MMSFNLHHWVLREYAGTANYLCIVSDHQNSFKSTKNHLLLSVIRKYKGEQNKIFKRNIFWKADPIFTSDGLLFQCYKGRQLCSSSFVNSYLLVKCVRHDLFKFLKNNVSLHDLGVTYVNMDGCTFNILILSWYFSNYLNYLAIFAWIFICIWMFPSEM